MSIKLKSILATVFILATGIQAYAASDSLNIVSDFRVTDNYTGLVYGSINSELMQYGGNDSGITFGDGIHINTSNEFSVNVREDVLDAVAAETDGRAEFLAGLEVISCETLGVMVKTPDEECITMWEGAPDEGEHTVSIVSEYGVVYMSLNGNTVSAAKCVGVPSINIYGKNAVIDITDVSYSKTLEGGHPAEVINISNDVRSSLELCMDAAGLNKELYQKLPECDKAAITERIAAARPFESEDALKTAYDKIVSDIIGVDTTKYAKLMFEDFESGLNTDLWTVSGTPQVLAHGSDPFGGGKAQSEALSGKSLVTSGKKLSKYGGISYELPACKSIVKLYFYDNMINNPAFYAVTVNEKLNIGIYDKYSKYRINEAFKSTGVARSVGWHKLELDTINQEGLCVYIDGTQVYSDEQAVIEKIFIGNCYSYASFSWVSTDNISIAVPDGTVIADIPHSIVQKGENAVKVTKYTTGGNYDVTDDYSITCQSKGFTADGVASAIGAADFEAQVSGDGVDTAFSETLYVTNGKRVYIKDAVYSSGTLTVTLEGEGKTDSAALIAAVYDVNGVMCGVQTMKLADIPGGSNTYVFNITNYPDGGKIKAFLMSSLEEIKPIYTAVKAKVQ